MNTKPSVEPLDCLMSCCFIDCFITSLKYVVLGTVANYSLHDMSSSAPRVKHQFLFRFSEKNKNKKSKKRIKTIIWSWTLVLLVFECPQILLVALLCAVSSGKYSHTASQHCQQACPRVLPRLKLS